MKISLFVHELLPQIGHSRALIELMNGLSPEQKAQVELIEAVCCESGNLDELFPEFKCRKQLIKIPGKGFKPFILKMLSYHLFSYFYSVLFCRNKIKIGIGIACLNVDIANIQFIHEQWKEPFFSKRKMGPVTFIYKKILFLYFAIGEKILFSDKKRHFIVIARFLQGFIEDHFQTNTSQFTLIPSGVNTTEFKTNPERQKEIEQELISKYPVLKTIDFNKPVTLFIGAFERKGLDKALEYLAQFDSKQLILIGKPESFSQWKFPQNLNIAHISFTKEVNKFYAVSDLFLFPTYYEPFGLVIIEAFAMGLDIIVPADNVGASEILPADEGVHYFKQNESIPKIEFKKISPEVRSFRMEQRTEKLLPYNWKAAALKFYSILSRY